jgi:hypothetical protein
MIEAMNDTDKVLAELMAAIDSYRDKWPEGAVAIVELESVERKRYDVAYEKALQHLSKKVFADFRKMVLESILK